MNMGDGNDQSASTVNTDATSSTGAQAMSFTMEQLNTIIQSAITGTGSIIWEVEGRWSGSKGVYRLTNPSRRLGKV